MGTLSCIIRRMVYKGPFAVVPIGVNATGRGPVAGCGSLRCDRSMGGDGARQDRVRLGPDRGTPAGGCLGLGADEGRGKLR